MVIVGYRPKPRREADLLALVRDHVPELRRLGLATERPALAMRCGGGTIVEVFEWRDGAIAGAHENPEIVAMWRRYAALCDYVPLKRSAGDQGNVRSVRARRALKGRNWRVEAR